jgi:hypothetical protein
MKSKESKHSELIKYRDLVLATIDYFVEKKIGTIKTDDFDGPVHYNLLKLQTEEHYRKGRLTKLKQWFRDMTEMQVETRDLNFNEYLFHKTGYNIDIFKSYIDRVNKIVTKGKILSDSQYYDINSMVDILSHMNLVDKKKMEILNRLLLEYEQKKH